MVLSSNPTVQVTFDSADRMSCTLFLQNKADGSEFQQINPTFNNASGNVFSFTIDPTKPPINGSSFKDLSGCNLGWVVKCFDLDKKVKITFSFEIAVIDSGSKIMSDNFTEKSDSVVISKSGNTAVFDGALTFP